MSSDPNLLILLYFVLPIWLIAGFADWLCHRRAHIESTAGPKESLLHLLMFAEVGVPLLLGLFLEINSLLIAIIIAAFFIHEATAFWDVSYATAVRRVTPIEQHVHSFLELMPLMAAISVISLHWTQFLALFGLGTETPRFDLSLKRNPLPTTFLATLLSVIVLFELLPYMEELLRGVRAGRGKPRNTTG
ncbi:MAG TPA: hypothetical protein VGO37_06745 [Steroidobacteraceae bacterium]|nr:hypothetical protein [Steroidobacteraceae bacterium]